MRWVTGDHSRLPWSISESTLKTTDGNSAGPPSSLATHSSKSKTSPEQHSFLLEDNRMRIDHQEVMREANGIRPMWLVCKRSTAQQLLRGLVSKISSSGAIPLESYTCKPKPFAGDHILMGEWFRGGTILRNGSQVLVKVFSGAEELGNFDTERKMLTITHNMEHVQRMVLEKTSAETDRFAMIVSVDYGHATAYEVHSLPDLRAWNPTAEDACGAAITQHHSPGYQTVQYYLE